MEIEVEPPAPGRGNDAIEQAVEARRHIGDAAEDTVMLGDEIGKLVEERLIGGRFDGDQRHALQVDAPCPGLPHLREYRPGDAVLRGHGIEMGAQQPGAMRIGTAQGKFHAGSDIGL